MKSTGVVRRIDELGRIVLPIELRKTMGLMASDGVEIYVQEDMIVLKKHSPACIFCGSADDMRNYMGKNVCLECAQKLAKS